MYVQLKAKEGKKAPWTKVCRSCESETHWIPQTDKKRWPRNLDWQSTLCRKPAGIISTLIGLYGKWKGFFPQQIPEINNQLRPGESVTIQENLGIQLHSLGTIKGLQFLFLQFFWEHWRTLWSWRRIDLKDLQTDLKIQAASSRDRKSVV